ncbi:MAG: hypothetical protein ACYSTT_20000 [Planctomycetota bacterium]
MGVSKSNASREFIEASEQLFSVGGVSDGASGCSADTLSANP